MIRRIIKADERKERRARASVSTMGIIMVVASKERQERELETLSVKK